MPTTPARTPIGRNRALRLAGFVVGVAALVAAIIAVRGNLGPLRETVEKGIDASVWVPLLALPLVSLLLTAKVFQLLTNARLGAGRRLSFGEMLELIGASWLLNFLPLSPGLFGRVAYQKSRHGIPLKDSAAVVVESIVLSWLAVAVVVPMAFVSGSVVYLLCAVLVLAGIVCVVAVQRFGLHSIGAARAFTFFLKLLDQACWAGRYYVVFRALGWHPTAAEACLIAAVAQVAMLVPFIGNGLGIREWVVGLVAVGLPGWFRGSDGAGTTLSNTLSADLLNRAFEMVLAVPIGIWCLMRLRARSGRGDLESPETDGNVKKVDPS